MINDKKALANEFIIRYQINKAKDNANLMEKFFIYANYNKDYIKLLYSISHFSTSDFLKKLLKNC